MTDNKKRRVFVKDMDKVKQHHEPIIRKMMADYVKETNGKPFPVHIMVGILCQLAGEVSQQVPAGDRRANLDIMAQKAYEFGANCELIPIDKGRG